MLDYDDPKALEFVTKEELWEGLKEIRDRHFTNYDDSVVWMDDRTPLGLYIDMLINRNS